MDNTTINLVSDSAQDTEKKLNAATATELIVFVGNEVKMPKKKLRKSGKLLTVNLMILLIIKSNIANVKDMKERSEVEGRKINLIVRDPKENVDVDN